MGLENPAGSTAFLPPSPPGTYAATVTVTDSRGVSSQATVTVMVVEGMVANFTVSPSGVETVGQPVTLTGEGLGGLPPYSYQWTVAPNGTVPSGVISTNAMFNYTPTSAVSMPPL